MIDVLVVGSGPGGVNAAARLAEAGLRVVMLDYGNEDRRYAPLIPRSDFTTLRRTDAEQHRYFLGDGFEGIPFGPVRVGAQLTPPRGYILTEAPTRLPVDSPGFATSASLARGGLGAGWSAGVFPFADDELGAMGLTLADLQPHYDAAAERIGVAGDHDDLAPFFPESPAIMPALELDSNAELVVEAYRRKREALHRRGFFLGRTRLAVCTRAHRGRGPYDYLDLDYWADMDRAVYRPQWTLEELQRLSNFTYVPRRLVSEFVERGDVVRVRSTREESGGGDEWHEARALVLAAGTFGTVRIVLRSLGRYDTPVPLLCNAYTYVPTVNLAMLGRPARDRRASLAQLTAMMRFANPSRLLQAQVFSYRSLLTFKLMKEVPLSCRQSLRVLRLLMPSFAILGIHHEDRPAPGKTVALRRGEPDVLEVRYDPGADEERRQRADERALLRHFRRLGCVPLKAIRPGHGSSIHYAGTFPITPEADAPLTCDRDSRLRATRSVYLADGSVFPWLPAKGLTFNIMANADRVGALLTRRLG